MTKANYLFSICKILLVSIIIYTSSCKDTRKKQVRFFEFPSTDTITGMKIEEFKIIPANSRLLIAEDYYISFSQATSRGYYFTAFDKKTLSPVSQFAKKGSAPHELRLGAAPLIDQENNKVFLVDVGRNNYVFQYDIKKAINDSMYIPEKLFKYGKENAKTIRFTYCLNDIFLTQYINESNDSVDYQYTFLDKTGQIIGNYEPINHPTEYPQGVRQSLAFAEKLFCNGKIYTAFAKQDKILCYDFKQKETIFEISGPRTDYPEIEIQNGYWIPSEIPAPISYISIAVSNKYIYTLNVGDYQTTNSNVKRQSENLWVFNLKGKPIKQIKLNTPIYKIYYDKYTNQLICMAESQNIYNSIGIIRIELNKVE
jgi:hypothetical protein